MKKKAKKFLVLLCLGGVGYGLVKLLALESVKDKLFECMGEDNYLKAESIALLLGDLLMWPVHFVKALLP